MKKLYPLLLLCCLASTLIAYAQKKYNVIFIITDDMSIAFEPYGNLQAPTPNFLRLMQHGVLFKQTYVQYALCSPSRTSLLSGQRPDSTGVVSNRTDVRSKLGANYRFLPEYFHDYGYRTESYGKVGPCGHAEEISWDNTFRADDDFEGEYPHIPSWWIDTLSKTESETMSGINVDSFLVKIKQPVAWPYFYGLGLTTHNPFTPILASWNKTGDSTKNQLLPIDKFGTTTNIKGNNSRTIILPDTPPDDTVDIPPCALKDLLSYSGREVKDLRHAYYSSIIQEDVQLGVVLDELDRRNLWDSSIVIFMSDHGLHMGEHQGLWLKKTLFEEALRVPFVICAPGKKKAEVCDRLVELVDIFPTLTELCGLPTAANMQGSSLVPLLENPHAKWKAAIFAQRAVDLAHDRPDDPMGRAVRTNTFHYNTWLDCGEELYDIRKDPKEYTNLAGNPQYLDTLKRMRRLLAKGWQGVNPPSYKKTLFYRDADGDGYGNSNESLSAYFKPDEYSNKGGDCDDNNNEIYPGGIKSCASNNEISLSKDITLFPNPTTGGAMVRYNSKNTRKIILKVYDGMGNVLFSKAGNAITGSNIYQLNLSHLKPGVYDLELNNGTLPQRTKLIIAR
jgi:uncharacterized sulfatase